MNKIWTYWEGPLPEWIRLCQISIENHSHGSLVVLNEQTFESLWINDRDIDLSNLKLAQKADFVRIYMLKHYGGLWIDTDCIIMKDLQPMLKTCELWDFVAYKDWSGSISNAFIGCCENSKTADFYYKTVCSILRQCREISWTEIGQNVIHTTYSTIKADRLRLAVDFVMPYCWSDNNKFFIKRSDEEHETIVNSNALTYMMSNQSIKNFKGDFNSLIENDTFFSFLIRKSNENCIRPS